MTHTDTTMRQVSVTYMPPTGFPIERRFTGLRIGDVAFALSSLASRTRGRAVSAQVRAAANEARAWQVDHLNEQITDAVDDALGWWARLLPGKVRARLVRRMAPVLGDSLNMAEEVAELNARVYSAEQRLRHTVRGPRVQCSQKDCVATTALACMGEGWSLHINGAYCPKHAATTTPKKKAITAK